MLRHGEKMLEILKRYGVVARNASKTIMSGIALSGVARAHGLIELSE